MKKRILILAFFILAVVSFPDFSCAKDKEDMVIVPDTTLIDVPTSGILDYYGFLFTTRFFSDGGVLGSLNFGVMERLNLGASMIVERLIGSDSSIKMRRPEIQVKFRFYDGGYYLPSLAVGFDGQGYFYDSGRDEYMQKGHGLYVAASKEAFMPNLVFHGGLNVPDFDDNYIFGYLAANYIIEDKLSLMFEYDNFFHKDDPSRVNAGARFYITPYFHFDMALRDLNADGKFPNGLSRKTERIVQLKYNTSF